MGQTTARTAGPTRAATLRCMRIPSDEEILGLHEKHAPTSGAFDLVYTHCVIVCGIAEQLQIGRAHV